MNFLTAEVQGHAIAKCRVRQPRALFFSRGTPPLHLVEQAGAVVFVPDFEHIGVGEISFAEGIVEGRGNEIGYGLFENSRNRFPWRAGGNGKRLRLLSNNPYAISFP